MRDSESRLVKFIQQHPTAFHVVAGQADLLETSGYQRLSEGESWHLKPGGKYYVTRNGSAIMAFRLPVKDPAGFMILASHGDSPGFRIKPNPEIEAAGAYTTLNVESYGGAILNTWLDRPLSVAGRITVKTEKGLSVKLMNIDRDLLLIPNLAIHQNRKVNEGVKLNVQKDLQPLFGLKECTELEQLIAAEAGVDRSDILSQELSLYVRSAPTSWGADENFISSPRLDNVQCAFSSLEGFLKAKTGDSIPIHLVYDNEEVGSGTKQGAASTFLKDTLKRIVKVLACDGDAYHRLIANSFMLSADNAHAIHPNSPEKFDPIHHPVPGSGVVVKIAANQKYTTDGLSEGLVKLLAQKAGVPLQVFVNHSDQAGGSTLGNLSGNQVPVKCVDIGLAQLAMHSAFETCGVGDTDALISLAKTFFESTLFERDGNTYLLD